VATVQAMELPNGSFVIVFGEISRGAIDAEAADQLRTDTGAASILVFEEPIEVRT